MPFDLGGAPLNAPPAPALQSEPTPLFATSDRDDDHDDDDAARDPRTGSRPPPDRAGFLHTIEALAPLTRRRWIGAFSLGGLAALALAGCAGSARPPASLPTPPIVFVHGNGDSAALWMTTEWRFESNGWPHDRLFAIDIPDPLARDVDAVPQPGRSSTGENRAALAAAVDRALAATGARQVVLMANSRGGYAVRSYIANGGAAKVSHAILCGTPNHGVWADPAVRPGNEFNGAGPFLAGLNAPKPDGSEVTPGPKWLTIRSDRNDKFAQPDGVWIGAKGTPTHVGFDGPALRGAENVEIAGIDHRETAFGPQAFEEAYRFLTGNRPAGARIARQPSVVLDGVVSGYGIGNDGVGTAPSNRPLAGATVEVYAVDPQTGDRLGAAAHRRTIGADGHWGPFAADASTRYEFVVAAPGHATSHVYRSPFPRSSELVHFRAERIAEADRQAAAVVVFTRPTGYFGLPRNAIALDGKSPPDGIPAGVAGVSSVKITPADATPRPIVARFDDERLVGRTWPAANRELTVLELTY